MFNADSEVGLLAQSILLKEKKNWWKPKACLLIKRVKTPLLGGTCQNIT